MIQFLFLSALLVISSSASANIPKLNTILSKITANSGGNKGFILKRTVLLKEENLTCNETWSISHADAMKVDVEGTNPDGSKWSFEILYKGGKRTTNSVQGKNQSFALSPEFYEPILHYHSSKALHSRLLAMQLVPNWSSSDSASSFTNLDRHKGGIVFILGANESKNTQQPPRLWIEQDSFLIKKLRMGSQIEVEFDAFKDFEEGKIKQPELQTVFWKNATVVIQNVSTQIVEQKVVEANLKIQKQGQAILPANENLKEFYSRFR